MDIVKVSIMGICGMMLGFILKETRPEFAALVTMMTGFLILGIYLQMILPRTKLYVKFMLIAGTSFLLETHSSG